jgi:GTP cyclohydrolase II
MLKALGIGRVRLLSNNPAKSRALTEQGIDVVELVPHSFGENPHNHLYLETKRDRQGHLL